MRSPRLMSVVVAAAVLVSIVRPALGQTTNDPFSGGGLARPVRRMRAIANVEFVDAPITTVFKMISDLTGWSIILSPQVSEKPPRINIWIKNMQPDEALEKIASMAELVVEWDGDTVKVARFEEYARTKGLEKQVVPLKFAIAKNVAEILKPFVAKEDQARILPDEEGNRVVLLAPAGLMESLLGLIRGLDAPGDDLIKVVRLEHTDTETIVPILAPFLTASGSIAGLPSPSTGAGGTLPFTSATRYAVRLSVDSKLNAVILHGRPQEVAVIVALIDQLDVPAEITVVGYQMKYTSASEVFTTLQDLVNEVGFDAGIKASRRLHMALSAQNNQVVVEGSASDHARVARFIETIDRPMPPGSGGIRVYRLENTSAKEVAATIQAIIADRSGRAVAADEGGIGRSAEAARAAPASADSSPAGGSARVGESVEANVIPASVTEAPQINAVVIRASASEHEEFAKLIEELDMPREQVLLEVTLVFVSSSEGFDLGLELSGARNGDVNTETIAFTSFGIGSVDSSTGALALAQPPPFGLSYAVFHSDDFYLVLNAMQAVGDMHITSAPKILVEDNTEASISQINQEPFEVISQGEATTTTSFGGFVDAGTQLTVTPHLSEQGWLRLQYTVQLSSFRDRENPSLPPPRAENLASGTVRIPHGYTVVLGGVAATNESSTVAAVPYLSDIPLLGELLKSRSSSTTTNTLFIFIRPVIMSEADFSDLRLLSRDELEKAGHLGDDSPVNDFQLIKPPSRNSTTEDL